MCLLIVLPVTTFTSKALSNPLEQKSCISNPFFRAKANNYALVKQVCAISLNCISKIDNLGLLLVCKGEQKFVLTDFG